MAHGTYRNTDHPNPTCRNCSPRREAKQREKAEREATEAERLRVLMARWDGMNDEQRYEQREKYP